jgi:hypothetical protein
MTHAATILGNSGFIVHDKGRNESHFLPVIILVCRPSPVESLLRRASMLARP